MGAAPVSNEATSTTIYTIGHSKRPLEEFMALLAESDIERVVDVRSLPGSNAFPQYDAENLHQSLAQADIHYQHMAGLGGRRKGANDDTRNAMWHNQSFRRYADYALTPAFAEALQELETHAASERCVVMCAEAVWWRCHRRIISDHLLARGHTVCHIMAPGKVTPATLTPGAQVENGSVTYPPEDDLLTPDPA